MPIRPDLRKFYGPQWRAYRLVLLALAKHRCAQCGEPHAMLNCAHVNHDPRENRLVSVWCPSCHARHDAPRNYQVRRRLQARRVGQLWLFPDVEWEPFPSWQVPRSVLAAAQADLFDLEEEAQ